MLSNRRGAQEPGNVKFVGIVGFVGTFGPRVSKGV